MAFWGLLSLPVVEPTTKTHPTYLREEHATPMIVTPGQHASTPSAATAAKFDSSLRPPTVPEKSVTPVRPPSYESFLIWCRNVLGVQTKLVIETFDYLDYMKAHSHNVFDFGDDFCDDDDDFIPAEEYPRLGVRGLAAATDIQEGEVVISVPLNAMISVRTTVDHDPVLSRLLGPKAREKYGWDDSYFEMAILTVSILYHRNLGESSPLYQYMQILITEPTESMPVLWTKDRLRKDASDGVRSISRAIQKDIKEMYVTVVDFLKEQHPEIFSSEAYSLNRFKWAFALVNSRHWHLPIPDLDTPSREPPRKPRDEGHGPSVGEQVPPADQPTEAWVKEQSDTRGEEEATEPVQNVSRHSFLVPVADLLNFGPPCTRSKFNPETQAFEVIATCPFNKGQEVTYWYSDDCDDVIISNYGFTHPLVPSCPSGEDWAYKDELWKRKIAALESEIENAYQDLDLLDRELNRMHAQLRDCDCETSDHPRKKHYSSRDEASNDVGVRGGSHDGDERKKWTRKSDRGL